jgi:hypothetical protein
MQAQLTTIYEEYQNTVCVNQDVFLQLENFTYNMLQNWCRNSRRKLNRLRTKGRGRCGLIEFTSIPDPEREEIIKKYGDPYQRENIQSFTSRLKADPEAAEAFAKAGLSPEKEHQHYTEAQILNLYGELLNEIETKKSRNPGFKKGEAKEKISNTINELKKLKHPNGKQKYPHNLPANYKALERRYEKYKEGGCLILDHGGRGNINKLKIKGEIADFILASYCLPDKPTCKDLWLDYSRKAPQNNWPELTENAIRQWLNIKKNKKRWVLARHGEAEYIRQFGHKLVRDKSDWFPNCYWAIDGSKLDWLHYKEGANYEMGADININLMLDIFSEKIIGYDYGIGTEDHASHFNTCKMTVQEAGVRPLMLTYDQQSAHKSAVMQELYDRLVCKSGGKHYPHRAHEHGSPVEQILGRFQKQVLNKRWHSDKQAITVRTADSRPNMDFIKRFRHKLKTVEELEDDFKYCVKKWNNMEHPHFPGKTRNEVYAQTASYPLEEITTFEMMRLFWVTTKDTRTYERDGIKPQILKKDFHFEVYDADGAVDLDFRDRYTGSKFHIQYDPNQLDNYVRLFLKLPNGDTKYIANAEPVKKVKNIPALMDDHDKARMHKMTGVRDKEIERIRQEIEDLQHRTGITEESMIRDQELELKYQGKTPKKSRAMAEAGPGSWASKIHQ